MKGLKAFITDIRNAKDESDEDRRVRDELVHIQKQFEQPSLSGYQRRKYLCKLLYIHLLGHTITFGFDEALKLTQSTLFEDKEVGYQAVQMYVEGGEAHWDRIYDSLDRDFQGKPDHLCLALNCLSCLCEYDDELVARYEAQVSGAMRSPEFEGYVKQKAALVMRRLVKADTSSIARHPEYITRAVPLLAADDPSLVLAVVPLLEFVASLDYTVCGERLQCIRFSVDKLYRLVVERMCPVSAVFHGNIAPFTVVKLFKLLEALVPDVEASRDSLDQNTQDRIRAVLDASISASIEISAASQESQTMSESCNVARAVLFGALSLAARINSDSTQSTVAADALCSLLRSPDVNTRYLSLGALLQIGARKDSTSTAAISRQFELVSELLKDRDVSVRRRALDLIYMICDSATVQHTCSVLVEYLEVADFSLKSDVAVKVAVLAETFATDASWYIITITKLLAVAGDYVEDDVWCRMAQIVVNNDKLQATACRTVVRYLKNDSCSESVLKLATFLLGEYGKCIESTTTLEDQFTLLQSHYDEASVMTRAMMLSAFFKFWFRCSAAHPRIVKIFSQESDSLNSEIQQRALEYLALIKLNNPATVNLVLVEMPPFSAKVSPLLARLGGVQTLINSFKLPEIKPDPADLTLTSPDVETMMARDTSMGFSSDITRRLTASLRISSSSSSHLPISPLVPSYPSVPPARNTSAPPAPPPRRGASVWKKKESDANSVLSSSSSSSVIHRSVILSPNWRIGYSRLCKFDQGIFFENSLIRIVCRIKRHRHTVHLELTYTNKSPAPISALITKFTSPSVSPYTITTQHPNTSIEEGGRTLQQIDVEIDRAYADADAPIIHISFVSGGLTSIKLKLPVILFKGLSPGAPLSPEEFFTRWNQIGTLGASGEYSSMVTLDNATTTANLSRVIGRLGFGSVSQIESQYNVVGAGILSTREANSGCLLRIELNPNDARMLKMTIRCTLAGLAQLLGDSLQGILSE